MKNGPYQIKQLLEQLEAGSITETQFMFKVGKAANEFHEKLRHGNNERPLPARMGTAKKISNRHRISCH
ncbi:hypothetical protein Fifi067_00063 [Erwinia phage Fifi067]|nr:hypothetical protein Fifi067_00063 [Erwinia phage Fifi067]